MRGPSHLLVLAGAAAPFVFACTVLVVAAAYPGYNHYSHAVSALGMARSPLSGPMNVLGFGVTGAFVVGFGVAFPRILGTDLATIAACGSWCSAGASFLCLGVWPYPHPFHNEFVIYCTLTSFAGVLAGAWSVSRTHRSSLLWAFSLFAGATIVDFFRLPVQAILEHSRSLGFQQRLHLAIVGTWLVATACVLEFISRQRADHALQRTHSQGTASADRQHRTRHVARR